MTEEIKILDHGYVRIVEHWGSDERIIEAARMSTNKGFQGWGPRCAECDHAFLEEDGPKCLTPGCGGSIRKFGDEKLLRYLWENKHATPFEMAGMIMEIQAPIFVFREWHRHRTQSYSELSARYTPLPMIDYKPTVERCVVVPGTNKQAAGAVVKVPSHAEVLDWLENLSLAYELSQRVYQQGLDIGIPKEVARLPVPVARYSRMRAGAVLRNWLAFLTLRMAPNAQWEIRQYANAVGELISERFPRTWELFAKGIAG